MKLNKFQLKRLLPELEGLRSRHTELVSVYVPRETNLQVVKDQIAQEISTAANIKSKTTRKNVQAALDKALSELRYFKATPPNGLVVLAGNIAGEPGQMELEAWSFEPPEEIQVRMYKCDQQFILEPLYEMIEPKYVFGLVVMDDKEAVIGLLKGKKIIVLKEYTSMVPGKTRAGGQSSLRFKNVRREIIKHWHKKIGEVAVRLFKSYDNLKGVLVGGSGPSKDRFLNSGHLGPYKGKVISIQNTTHSGSVALEELVDKSESILAEEELLVEKHKLMSFLTHLGKDDGLASYGLDQVKQLLTQGAVELLLLSEFLSNQLIDELTAQAEEVGSEVFLVSTDSKEGEQLKQLGGVGAVLRYAVKY